MISARRTAFAWLFVGSLLAGTPAAGLPGIGLSVAGAAEPVGDPDSIDRVRWLMYDEPPLQVADPEVVVPEKPKPLWRAALGRREDAPLRRLTLDTVALAHRRGMLGMDEFVPEIVGILEETDLDSGVKRASVAALIELNAPGHDALLAEVARQSKPTVSRQVERALARRESAEMRDDWLSRLDDSGAAATDLRLAIEGLGSLEEPAASEPLVRIVTEAHGRAEIRLAAARALGAIHRQGMTELAAELAGAETDPSPSNAAPIESWLAFSVIQRHTDEAAKSILKRFCEHPDTALQAAALGRLFEIDPAAALVFATDAVASPDVNVRREAARAMIAEGTETQVSPLAALLDDENPSLRREIAAALVALAAENDLKQQVIAAAEEVLSKNDWRGCEQAALVLVNLEHRPAGDRLVELLAHPRDEVMVTSAWGLRRFAVDRHLPEMLERAKEVHRGFREGRFSFSDVGVEHQVGHLFTAFGNQTYAAAEELMREYVPKDPSLGPDARPAAVWALGRLHEDKDAPPDLAEALQQRLDDWQGPMPERGEVRRMAMISLARMNVESSVESMRAYGESDRGLFGAASRWAIERMTGESTPQDPPLPIIVEGWFLSPTK